MAWRETRDDAMIPVAFRGFGGIRLEADVMGDANDPAILLVHGAGQTRAVWREASDALVRAGRRVVCLDLRGHGDSERSPDGRYDLDSHVEDLRAVLAQMGSRPVVVATTFGGWITLAALAQDAGSLAAGLVLVDVPVRSDPETAGAIGAALRRRAQEPGAAFESGAIPEMSLDAVADRLVAAAPGIAIPTLFVRGGMSRLDRATDAQSYAGLLPDCEIVIVEDEGLLVRGDRTEAFSAVLLDFLERKHPRAAPEYRIGSDARTLRDALGCFATGITVVTAIATDGKPIGLTANSFTSVSLDPPLLLVCIANSAGSAPVLRSVEHFGVNVLQIGQQIVSGRFAGKGEDRFAQADWSVGETGAPLLAGSLGAFECRRHAVHDAGDHFLLVGEVMRAQFDPRRDPLLYFRGKYRRLHFA